MAVSLDELFKNIIYNFPNFKEPWESDRNLFINEDGSYTPCGLLSEFSHFYVDKFESLDKTACKSIFDLFEVIIEEDNRTEQYSDIAASVEACFLENISQTKAGEDSMVWMGPRCKEYFIKWHKYPL